MVEHEGIKEKDEENLKNEWWEDVHLLTKLGKHRVAFFEMVTELESIQDGQIGRLNVSKHPITLIGEEARPVQFGSYRKKPTTGQFAGQK